MMEAVPEEISLEEGLPEEHDDGDGRSLSEMNPRVTAFSYIMSHQRNYSFLPDLYWFDHAPAIRKKPGPDYPSPARYNGGSFKTQADLDAEKMEEEVLRMSPEARVLSKRLGINDKFGFPAWSKEEALEYLENKRPDRTTKPRDITRREITIEEIYYEDRQRLEHRGLPVEKIKPALPLTPSPEKTVPYIRHPHVSTPPGRPAVDPVYPSIPPGMSPEEEALYWYRKARENWP